MNLKQFEDAAQELLLAHRALDAAMREANEKANALALLVADLGISGKRTEKVLTDIVGDN